MPRKRGTSLGQPTNLDFSAMLSPRGYVPAVLGIDASLVKPGFAMLDSRGTLVAWKRPDHTRLATEGRVLSIYNHTCELVKTHQPEMIVIETSAGIRFRGDGWRAGDALSFSRGVVWAAIVTSGVYPLPRVEEMKPDQVRRMLLGWVRGCPGKEPIIKYLQLIGYIIPTDKRGNVLDDVADAMALAVYVQTLYRNAGGTLK